MNDLFELAYKESLKSLKSNDVPVGAIVTKDGRIVAKAHNQREKKKNAIYHAECIAIFKAAKKLKSWNLNDCELYTTLKPCSMCEAIINNSRISKVYYLLNKNESKMEYQSEYIYSRTNVCYEISNKYRTVLSNFFAKIRKNK